MKAAFVELKCADTKQTTDARPGPTIVVAFTEDEAKEMRDIAERTRELAQQMLYNKTDMCGPCSPQEFLADMMEDDGNAIVALSSRLLQLWNHKGLAPDFLHAGSADMRPDTAAHPRQSSAEQPAVVHMSPLEVEPRSVASESPPHPDAENAAAFREIAAAVKRTRGDIETHWRHSEGAALHAAILAGKEAFAEGKSKEEVAAVIESAGAKVCGLEQWRRSGCVLIAEAHVIGMRGLRFGTLQEQADLEYIATGH